MKTDDLIDMLASGPDVTAPARPAQQMLRNVMLVACAVLVSTALMMTLLGIRHDLAEVVGQPAFWLKIAFVAALVWTGRVASARLASPGARIAMLPALIATPLLIMFVVAALMLTDAAPEQRAQLFWGDTWRTCAVLIAALSLPIFAAILKVMRDLAPTRLRWSGAAAGFAAGASAAAVYSLHCPEIDAPFIACWYVLGMLIPTGTGALIGPRVLRW